jgi:hypothetical protein
MFALVKVNRENINFKLLKKCVNYDRFSLKR